MSNNRLSLSHMSTGDRCHLCLLLREIGGRDRKGGRHREREERERNGGRQGEREKETD